VVGGVGDEFFEVWCVVWLDGVMVVFGFYDVYNYIVYFGIGLVNVDLLSLRVIEFEQFYCEIE